MNKDDLARLATDLGDHADLDVRLEFDPSPEGLHVLTITGVDFYFYADGSGYDGWGRGVFRGNATTTENDRQMR